MNDSMSLISSGDREPMTPDAACCGPRVLKLAPDRSIFPTPCECDAAGWCTRHKCEKNRVEFELCRRSKRAFERWELGDGAISRPQPIPLRKPCQHLGAEIRRQLCPSCQGHVEIKIFACALHGECARSEKADAVRCCQTCADHLPIHEPEAPNNSA